MDSFKSKNKDDEKGESDKFHKKELIVEVTGEVKREGVYDIGENPTLFNAIKKAGGMKVKIKLDEELLNYPMRSGERLVIERNNCDKGEVNIKVEEMELLKKIILFIPIDINKVGLRELECIPGIGSVLAKRIINFRSQHGFFEKIDNLGQVKGIGPAKLISLKEYLIVDKEYLISQDKYKNLGCVPLIP